MTQKQFPKVWGLLNERLLGMGSLFVVVKSVQHPRGLDGGTQ